MAADRIILTGIEVTARHGVYAAEKVTPQLFRIDLDCSLAASASQDDLATTVDYSRLAQAVAEVVGGESVDLIETLAERVAATCLAQPLIAAVTVTVHKPQAPMPVPVSDIAVSITRSAKPSVAGMAESQPVVLSIGSNLGDRLQYLTGAVAALRGVEGIDIEAISSVYETAPVGLTEQPDFLNIVVTAQVTMSAQELLAQAQAIEAAFDRVREVRWGARTLDIDLVSFGSLVRDEPELTLPHPRAHERAFVLLPWLELVPGAELGGRDVAGLLSGLDTSGVRRRDDLRVRS